MNGLPSFRRLVLQGAGPLAIALAVSSPGALAQEARPNGLVPMNPEGESPAPSDTGFALACRKAAQDRLGGPGYGFSPPTFSTRSGAAMVRMDITAREEPRDPMRVFRVVCRRDPATKAVEVTVFDAPRDDTGPRVVLLPGPVAETGAAPSPPAESSLVTVPTYPSYGGPYIVGLGAGYAGFIGPSCLHCSKIVVVPSARARSIALRDFKNRVAAVRQPVVKLPKPVLIAPKSVSGAELTVRLSSGFSSGFVRMGSGGFVSGRGAFVGGRSGAFIGGRAGGFGGRR